MQSSNLSIFYKKISFDLEYLNLEYLNLYSNLKDRVKINTLLLRIGNNVIYNFNAVAFFIVFNKTYSEITQKGKTPFIHVNSEIQGS